MPSPDAPRRPSERQASRLPWPSVGRGGGATATYAVRFLLASMLALALGWTLAPGHAGYFTAAGVVLAAASAVAVAASTPSRRAGFLTASGAIVLVWWGVLDTVSFELPLSHTGHLRLELLLALMPALAVALLVGGVDAARRELAGEDHLPLPLRWAAPVMFGMGGIGRMVEVSLLRGSPGTVETLRHALRYDIAFVVWTVAAVALAGALAYVAYASTGDGRRRSVRRVVATAFVAILLFSFVGYDLGVAAAVAADPPRHLQVGVHTSNIESVDPELVDFVHIEVPWSGVEKREGELNWTKYDRTLRHAEEKGLEVYLLAGTYPPRWLVEKHPDAVMVDQDGRPFTWLDEAPGAKRDRVWDLSFAHPEVVEAKQAFLAKVVARYADSPAVFAVAIQNEPSWPADWNLLRYASYDPWTRYGFHTTLMGKYGDVDALNENLTTAYGSFFEVRAPTNPFDPLWGEWLRYREDLLIQFVEDQVAVAKAHTDKPVTVKIVAHFLTRFAEPQAGMSDRVVRAFADASDVVSIDIYPANLGALERELRYFKHVADGKPLIVSEFNMLLGTNIPTGGAQLLAALDIIGGYATHVSIFTVNDHYLYGMTALPRSPSLTALTLLKTSPLDPDFHAHLGALLVEDLLAVENLYVLYVLGSTAIGIPAIPAPLLLLLVLPVPAPTRRLRRAVAMGRVTVVAAAALFMFTLVFL